VARRGTLARSLALIALCAVALAGAPVLAEPTAAELTQARERFAAARKLEDGGQWTEALGLLQRVAEVRTTPQVRFHIALCLENLGLWTQALDAYAQVEGEAAAPEVLVEAREHVRALSANTPTVSLVLTGAQPGDLLLLDNRRVSWDGEPLPIRVDPGPHTVEVQRGGVVIARELFAVQKQTTRRVELKLPPSLGSGPAPRASAEPTVDGPPTSASSTASAAPAPAPSLPPPPVADGRVRRIAGWSAIGVGGVSLILTGVFAGLRTGALHRLEGECPTFANCSRGVSPIVAEGKTYAALVNVFGAASLVTLGGGAALVLTAPRLVVAPMPGGAAVVAEGAF
jgi:hypothetical protein